MRRTSGMRLTSFMRLPTMTLRSCRRAGRSYKAINFFGPMLTIGIQNDDKLHSPIQPVTKAGFDRFALPAIFRVDGNLRAGFAREVSRFHQRIHHRRPGRDRVAVAFAARRRRYVFLRDMPE